MAYHAVDSAIVAGFPIGHKLRDQLLQEDAHHPCVVRDMCLVALTDRRDFPKRDVAQPMLKLYLLGSCVTGRVTNHNKLMIELAHRFSSEDQFAELR